MPHYCTSLTLIFGFLDGGIEAWEAVGKELDSLESISAEQFEADFEQHETFDVRKPGEYASEHVENATTYPLDFMNDDLTKLDKNETYHIHCAGGYRSVIAISILKQKGFENLIDVAGGFGAIKKSNLNESCYSSFAQCAG